MQSASRWHRQLRTPIEPLESRQFLAVAAFSGHATAVFTSPIPQSADTSGLNTSSFGFGSGEASTLTFSGRSFEPTAPGALMWLGTLDYYNGVTQGGTAVDSVTMRVSVTLDQSTLSNAVTFDFPLVLTNTPNSPDPFEPDYVTLTAPAEAVKSFLGPDGVRYTLKLSGFGRVNGAGYSAVNEFYVTEGGSASARLLGTIAIAPTQLVDWGALSGEAFSRKDVNDTIGGENIDDYYKFSIAKASNITIALWDMAPAVKGQKAKADLDLLHDADGDLIIDEGEVIKISHEEGKLDEWISHSLAPGENYYVRVRSPGAPNTGYKLTCTVTPYLSGGWGYVDDNDEGPTQVMGYMRLDGTTAPLDPEKKTWVVIHGRVSGPRIGENLKDGLTHSGMWGLAHEVQTKRPTEQVILLDWSSASREPDTETAGFIWDFWNLDGSGEHWIPWVAQQAATKLSAMSINGENLNLIGHSWGSYVAAEIARIEPVDTLIGLDPARNVPNNDYDPDDRVDFGDYSRRSWAFHSSLLGSSGTPETADAAISVRLPDGLGVDAGAHHSQVVEWFRNTLRNPNPINSLFALEKLVSEEYIVPWAADRFDAGGGGGGDYEAALFASAGGAFTQALMYESQMELRVLQVNGTSGDDQISVHISDQTTGMPMALLAWNGDGRLLDLQPGGFLGIDAFEGNDAVAIGSGFANAYVLGGAGDDTITGGSAPDTLVGGGGKDVMDGGAGDDRLDGGPSRDQLRGGGNEDRLYGGEANDYLEGGAGVDRIWGGNEDGVNSGNDYLVGGSSNDKLFGGDGSDTLLGNNQNDLLIGGADDDFLYGHAGDDTADNDPLDLREQIEHVLP